MNRRVFSNEGVSTVMDTYAPALSFFRDSNILVRIGILDS